jgi:hypothetical protein
MVELVASTYWQARISSFSLNVCKSRRFIDGFFIAMILCRLSVKRETKIVLIETVFKQYLRGVIPTHAPSRATVTFNSREITGS